jgi:hypothetical protein
MKMRSTQKFSMWSLNGIYPKVVTPECFYRGASLNMPPGFPPKDGSVRSHVADPLKACGNDGLRKGANLRSKLRGIQPA